MGQNLMKVTYKNKHYENQILFFLIKFNIPQFILMIKHNENLYDLPLQPKNQNHYQLNIKIKSKDMPKQLSKDCYRANTNSKHKQNTSVVQQIQEVKIVTIKSNKQNILNEKVQPMMGKPFNGGQNNCHLRKLIQKQLQLSSKSSKLSAKTNNILILQRENKQNRYKQLLNQVYGKPNDHSNKNTNKMRSQSTQKLNKQNKVLTNCQTQKKLTNIQQTQNTKTLNRHQSNISLKPFSQKSTVFPHSTKTKATIPSQQLTYLDLYWQRRRPVLQL